MIENNLSDFGIWLVLTSIFMIRYLVIVGILYFIFYKWKRTKWLPFKFQNKTPKRIQIIREIKFSLLTFLIYGLGVWLFLYWIRNGMTQIYVEIDDYGLLYFLTSIMLMIFAHDTYFYWTHRLIHHSILFKYIHKTHHTFDNPTPWAAFAFHPLEAIISIGIVPIILFIIPFHHFALIIFITFLTVYNAYIHLGISVPEFKWFQWQNTSKEHDLHHNGVKGNFGLYFTFWDKTMNTYILEHKTGQKLIFQKPK